MAIFLLVAALLILFIFSALLNKGDILSPATLMSAAFLFSTIAAVYNLPKWEFVIGYNTVAVIVGAIVLTILVSLVARQIVNNTSISSRRQILKPIPANFVFFAIAITGLTAIAMFYQVHKVGGSGALSDVMFNYRSQNAYSVNVEDQLPFWLSQLLSLSYVLAILYIWNLVRFNSILAFRDRVLSLLPIALNVVASLLTGGRFSTLTLLFAGVTIYWFSTMHNGRKKKVRISTIISFIVIACVVLYGFYLVKNLVGRDSDDTVVDYITHYAGGAVPALDLYFKNPPQASDIFGKESFYSIINGLRKLGMTDTPYYFIHHEFRVSNGVGIGNVYTALRDYHYDFGIVGLFALHIIFSLIFCFFYEYQKKRGSDLAIVIFSMMYYCVPLYVISNCFYASILSFGFAIKCIELIILFKILGLTRKGNDNSVVSGYIGRSVV